MTGTGSLRGSSFRLPCKRTTASSRLTSSPPPSPSTSLVRSFFLFLSLSLLLCPPPSCLILSLSFSLSSLSADPPLTSFSIRPDARLRTCASLVSSRSSDRPAGRPLLSLYHHISPSPLVFRTKELPHARNGSPPSSFFVSSPLLSITPMRCSSLACTFCHSRSTTFISSSLFLFLTS